MNAAFSSVFKSNECSSFIVLGCCFFFHLFFKRKFSKFVHAENLTFRVLTFFKLTSFSLLQRSVISLSNRRFNVSKNGT